MLGKLKSMAGAAGLDSVIDKIQPQIQQQIDSITSFKTTDLQDDNQYATLISNPVLMSINASSGGVTKMIPGFEKKFLNTMLSLRNELVDLSGEKPVLKEGYQDKLPAVLLEGFKG
tara:strand:- start:260 stop:607 length:348 start_codon:yes stop_codon:yes gene_type:complete